MDIGRILDHIFSDYTTRTVAIGAMVLGFTSGALGTFAVLRRQSLIGDAISHAALPGIVVAFLLVGTKDILALMVGAGVAGWLGATFGSTVVRTSRLSQDSSLGLVLSVFFGLGLVLLTFLQRQPNAGQAGLETFLFGQAAALVERDVWVMALLGALALLVTTILWKEFKLFAFDPGFAASIGFRVRLLEGLVTALLVLAIVIGLQAVGVVLMSAMLVAPAAAARQWTRRLETMVLLSGGFGALAGVSGALWSASVEHMPTGPAIVLVMTALAGLSLAFAPERGLVWGWFRLQRVRRQVALDRVLLDLHRLEGQHSEPVSGHDPAVLEVMAGHAVGVRRTLCELASRGLVEECSPSRWRLTARGLSQVRPLAEEIR